jgi:hypothetical protein
VRRLSARASEGDRIADQRRLTVKHLHLIIVAVLLLASSLAAVESHKLTGVKWVQKDLYKTSDGLYLETVYCPHRTHGEDAILRWDAGGSGKNKIIWADMSTCRVKSAKFEDGRPFGK